jgi:hypothetical protein
MNFELFHDGTSKIIFFPQFVRAWGEIAPYIFEYIHSNAGGLLGMIMTLRAGALALAMTALLTQATPSFALEAAGVEQSQLSASINIARIKSVLKLTPEQMPYWAPVERALLDLGRQQQPEQAGLVRRLSNKVVSIALSSRAIQRLAVAARPLIASLDTDQKLAAMGLADEMGLGPVIAALN